MKPIESFKINHDVLTCGMYISRIDRDVITYDIRSRRPNMGDYMSNAAMHTVEHLFATYVRNSIHADEVIYFGPMGCRTGFYLLLRDTVSKADAIELVRQTFAFIGSFDGTIPGSAKKECGNYQEHSLPLAKEEAKHMSEILRHWTEDDLRYPDAF